MVELKLDKLLGRKKTLKNIGTNAPLTRIFSCSYLVEHRGANRYLDERIRIKSQHCLFADIFQEWTFLSDNEITIKILFGADMTESKLIKEFMYHNQTLEAIKGRERQ